jgi:Fe2+ transport system protein FeoA
MTLDMLTPGRSGRIIKVNGEGAIRLRLLDMGLTPKTDVLVYKAAPMGDPIELHLRGYSLSIRIEEAQNIEVEENRS